MHGRDTATIVVLSRPSLEHGFWRVMVAKKVYHLFVHITSIQIGVLLDDF